jgi:hypothetical protein
MGSWWPHLGCSTLLAAGWTTCTGEYQCSRKDMAGSSGMLPGRSAPTIIHLQAGYMLEV